MLKAQTVVGYLPDEKPPFWKLLFYALQQVIVMFPATVAVALITGFQVSTTIFASGLATLCFIFITGKRSSLLWFQFLTSDCHFRSDGGVKRSKLWSARKHLISWKHGEVARQASFRLKPSLTHSLFIMSGLISIAAGFLVKAFGTEAVEKYFPPALQVRSR